MELLDLKIGNSILIITKPSSEEQTTFGEIIGLTGAKIGGYMAGVKVDGGAIVAELDVIHGVPLTPELLLERKFKQGDNISNNNTFYVLKLEKIQIVVNPENGVAYVGNNHNDEAVKLPVKILYLHELENLVYSCSRTLLSVKN